MRPYLAIGGFLVLASLFTVAQVNPVAGNLPFATQVGGPYDQVDLATGNILITIPVRAKNEKIPFSFALSGNSVAYTAPYNGNYNGHHYTSEWLTYFSILGMESHQTLLTSSTRTITCNGSTKDPESYAFVITDAAGTAHPFPSNVKVDTGGCDTLPVTGVATDGSGYTMEITSGSPADNFYVWDKTGTLVVQNYTGVVTDPDGATETVAPANGYTTNPFTFTDSLDTQALVVTLGSGGSGNGTPDTYTYTGGDGKSTDGVTISYTEYDVLTVFGCSNILDQQGVAAYLPTSISITGLGTFTIGYEVPPGYQGQKGSNGLSYVTGRIGSITYPTGGSVTYGYSGGNNNSGMNCTTLIVPTLTRSVYDNYSNSTSTWTYVNNNTSKSSFTYTIVETGPATNQTIHNFAGEYQTFVQSYQGGCPTGTNGCNGGGTLMKTINTCYGGNGSPPPTPPNCTTPTSVPPLPITETDVYTSISGSATNRVNTTFDTYGNVTSVLTYDFGGTPLLSSTYISYGQSPNGTACTAYPSGTFIYNTPCYTYTTNSATTTVAQTQITNNSTGHPTSIAKWVAGTGSTSTSLTTNLAYGGNGAAPGVLSSVTDVNGAMTNYYYNGGCNGMLLTSIALPVDGLTESQQWNCNGGVVTETIDPNNQSNHYYYNDPLWRVTSMTDAANVVTTYTYTPTTFESAMNFGTNSTVDTLITTDGLGRPIFSQTRQSQGSSNFDTIQTSYGWTTSSSTVVGGPFTITTMPYAGTQAQAAPAGTPVTTTQNDALGRPYTVTDGGGGTTSYSYVQNDVLVTVGPSPQTFARNFQYNGLGQLTSVCEVNSLSGSGACGQANAQTGFLTNYTYDPLGNMLTVAQNAQPNAIGGTQTRIYTYDGISRMTSETNPESGKTTYLYDTVAAPGVCNGYTGWAGDLLQVTKADGSYTCYNHDGLHRLFGIENSIEGTANFCKRFRYDNSSNGLTSGPSGATFTNVAGRLVEAETDTCAAQLTTITDEWFSYDPRGPLNTVWESTPNSGGYYEVAVGRLANYVASPLNLYNSSGAQLIPTQTYGVDGEGRINSVTASSGQSPVTTVNYVTSNGTGQPVGALTQVTFGSSDSDTYSYSTATGRMQQYSFNVNGQSAVGNLQWNLNGTLQQLGITDPFNSQDNQTCTYSHDPLDRVSGVSCGSTWAQTFSYDAFGNITKSGSISWQPTYNSPANNQYLAGWDNVSYDANGNLLIDPYNTYTWDVYGDLTSAYPNGSASEGNAFAYDAFGRMVQNQKYEFVYSPSGGQPLAVMNEQSPAFVYVPLPGGAFAMYNSSGIFQYNHPDWLGSARLFSTPNRTANPAMAYAPFGEGYAGGIQWIQFTTAGNAWTVADSENQTGSLEDFMFRRYSPTQGRWISPDPAGLAAVDPNNPQTWNRYSYVVNSPLSNIDPTGLACYPLERALFGSCANFMGNGVNLGWTEFQLMGIPFVSPGAVLVDGGCFGCGTGLDVFDFSAANNGGCTNYVMVDCGAANNGTPQTPQQKEQQCLNNFYNSNVGKAVQFGSPMALLPGWNPQWGRNLSEWGLAIVGKLGGLFGSGAMSGTTQLTTLSGTTTVGSTLELGTEAVLGAVEKVALPVMAVGTVVDVGAHINCGPAEPGPTPDMPGGGLP